MDSVHQYLAPDGKVCVISFHSLEDKIVTKAMRSWAKGEQVPRRLPKGGNNQGLGKLLTSKALTPGDQEIQKNPRSRSSLMRVFQRGAADS